MNALIPVLLIIVALALWLGARRISKCRPHCFHTASSIKERQCCHCGRVEEQVMAPLEGHGRYAHDTDKTIWVEKDNGGP